MSWRCDTDFRFWTETSRKKTASDDLLSCQKNTDYTARTTAVVNIQTEEEMSDNEWTYNP